MAKYSRSLALGIWLFGFGALPLAHGVDQKPLEVSGRWQVVGVISGSELKGVAFGIAVLKSVASSRTYTVSVGEALPTDGAFTLKSIFGKQVTITDGAKSFALDFAAGDVKEPEKAADGKNHFLDSYYRGLEASESDSEELSADEMGAFRNFPQGIQRFGSLRDGGFRSRFELYKPESNGQRFGSEGAENYEEPGDLSGASGDDYEQGVSDWSPGGPSGPSGYTAGSGDAAAYEDTIFYDAEGNAVPPTRVAQ